MTDRVETGLDILDRKLGGGIPVGRLVALEAAPVSQSELFLYEFAGAHTTLYLTTCRTERAIEAALGRAETDVVVDRVPADRPFEAILDAAEAVPDGTTVVLDPVNPLEWRSIDRYEAFLNAFAEEITASDGVAFLHCLGQRDQRAARVVTEHVVDIVFRLSNDVRGDSVENQLTVPKFRGGCALEEVINLNLTAEVDIDISRTIA